MTLPKFQRGDVVHMIWHTFDNIEHSLTAHDLYLTIEIQRQTALNWKDKEHYSYFIINFANTSRFWALEEDLSLYQRFPTSRDH